MLDLERYIRGSSNRLFSRGLRTEKYAQNASDFDLAKSKTMRTTNRAGGIIDLSRSSRVIGVGYRPRYPKIRTRVLYQGEWANMQRADEVGRI